MHASFSFHHSNLQLAYTTQAWNLNLKLVPCKQTYVMHIQMQHTSLWACSLYLCASNFNWSPYNVILFVCSPYLTIFVNYFSPFGIKYHKRSAQILDRLGWNHVKWGSFSLIWFNLDHFQKIFNSVWSKGKLLHTSFQGLSWSCWVKHL